MSALRTATAQALELTRAQTRGEPSESLGARPYASRACEGRASRGGPNRLDIRAGRLRERLYRAIALDKAKSFGRPEPALRIRTLGTYSVGPSEANQIGARQPQGLVDDEHRLLSRPAKGWPLLSLLSKSGTHELRRHIANNWELRRMEAAPWAI
jgi:hypothetical protein